MCQLLEELRYADNKRSRTDSERTDTRKRLRTPRLTGDHDDHFDVVVAPLAEEEDVPGALVD